MSSGKGVREVKKTKKRAYFCLSGFFRKLRRAAGSCRQPATVRGLLPGVFGGPPRFAVCYREFSAARRGSRFVAGSFRQPA
jgi:hypothetical protein